VGTWFPIHSPAWIWELLLLADCTARLAGAYTLPLTTMVWLSTVLTLGAVGLGIMVGGTAAAPIQKMIDADAIAGHPICGR
jgi:hypothetical protein